MRWHHMRCFTPGRDEDVLDEDVEVVAVVVDRVACQLPPAMFCPGRDEEEVDEVVVVDEVAHRLPHATFHPGGQAVTRRWPSQGEKGISTPAGVGA